MADYGKAALGLIGEIFTKILPIKIVGKDIPDGWENPLGTGAGQLVVSSQENWQARLARLGATRTFYSGKNNATNGTKTGVLGLRAPKGTQCFMTHAVISTNGPGLAEIIYSIGNDVFAYRKYISGPNGGSFEVKLDGTLMITNGNDFSLNFTADVDNCFFVASCMWMEVHE